MSSITSFDGTRLSASIEGPANAPTVVLVHGLGMSRDSWGEVPVRLADRHRVVAYDLRGHGASGDARSAAEAGRWEVLFTTQDESEWMAEVRRLRAEDHELDWSTTRMETLCGRLIHPTTYRLSVFRPGSAEQHGGLT